MEYFQHMNPYLRAALIFVLAEYGFLLWLYISYRIKSRTEKRKTIPGLRTSTHGIQIDTANPRLKRSTTKQRRQQPVRSIGESETRIITRR